MREFEIGQRAMTPNGLVGVIEKFETWGEHRRAILVHHDRDGSFIGKSSVSVKMLQEAPLQYQQMTLLLEPPPVPNDNEDCELWLVMD